MKTTGCLLTEDRVDREDDNAYAKKMVPLDPKYTALDPESRPDDHGEETNEDHEYHAFVNRVYFPEVKIVCCVARNQISGVSYCS